jgi:hypothetical protein
MREFSQTVCEESQGKHGRRKMTNDVTALGALAGKMIDELQVVQAMAEQDELMAALVACGRAETIIVLLRADILRMIIQRHEAELERYEQEIKAIKATHPPRFR